LPYCAKCGRELDSEAAFCPRCGTPVGGGKAGAPLSGIDSVIKEPAAQEYWVQRIVAFVIDAVIVYLVLGALALAFALPFFTIASIGTMAAMITGILSLVAGIVLVIYFAFFEMYAGASFGKRIMGLVVKSKRGTNPNGAEAFARNISKIHWVLLFLDIIGGLATSKEYTQKFSDRFVGTYVSKRQT